MTIKLFELNGDGVVLTEHCYTLDFLKEIIESYPTNYLKIISYLFYTTCRNPENPFFNYNEIDLEEDVLEFIKADFSTEDTKIRYAKDMCKKLYETPTVRAYNGISNMLDKLAFYMNTQEITDGRDGNISAIIQAAKNFDAIRKSFKGVAKDLEEEQSQRARGNIQLGYDQE